MRRSRKAPSSSSFYFSALVLVLAWCCSPVAASIAPGDVVLDEHMSAEFARLERAGEILVDVSQPPPNTAELRKRQGTSSMVDSMTAMTATMNPTSTTTPDGASPTAIATDPESSGGSDLPTPFDSGIGANYTTTSCPTFLKAFLANSTFQSCQPFSLLLQNSQSFFQAEKSIVRITQALDATCNVKLPDCASAMSLFARSLKQDNNCGDDYRAQNPLVVQAYNGLLAYEPLYHAGCLQDQSTGSYCFANAITNASSAADSYVYFLPLGVSLPGGARPTCNSCLQRTMATFSTFAANATQPLSGTYVAAAQQINIG
ncbi:hypothetical protein FGG08_004753 [Glutinoglossum americanum]|uniref:DUF7729 domain-containing protein n=1 Tax=Glutinoglossum americanum TaxID=1670608 RepID=A0A9P8KZ83_9PEZI|nr:hypothetical protein FGG08_004753 [Glutinoglossum americanum]